jgi:hypothetical protein
MPASSGARPPKGRRALIARRPIASCVATIALAGSTCVQAGALKGMHDPDRVPGTFIVMLNRDHIVALRNPALIDPHEKAVKSPKWQAAIAAVNTEVAQMVRKLAKSHPHVRVSTVMSEGTSPGFVLKASDEDALAIANEPDVTEVDADMLPRNRTSTGR